MRTLPPHVPRAPHQGAMHARIARAVRDMRNVGLPDEAAVLDMARGHLRCLTPQQQWRLAAAAMTISSTLQQPNPARPHMAAAASRVQSIVDVVWDQILAADHWTHTEATGDPAATSGRRT